MNRKQIIICIIVVLVILLAVLIISKKSNTEYNKQNELEDSILKDIEERHENKSQNVNKIQEYYTEEGGKKKSVDF